MKKVTLIKTHDILKCTTDKRKIWMRQGRKNGREGEIIDTYKKKKAKILDLSTNLETGK